MRVEITISTSSIIVSTRHKYNDMNRAHAHTHQPIWKISDKVNMKLIAVIELFSEMAVKRRARCDCECDCDYSPLF